MLVLKLSFSIRWSCSELCRSVQRLKGAWRRRRRMEVVVVEEEEEEAGASISASSVS